MTAQWAKEQVTCATLNQTVPWRLQEDAPNKCAEMSK